MLKVLDEKYTYEQLDKELCKNGYKIIDKLNYNCNRFNFFHLKGGVILIGMVILNWNINVLKNMLILWV